MVLFLLTTRSDRLVFGFFPIKRRIFSRRAPHLHDVSRGPALLMFLLAPFQIGGNSAVNDLLSNFEVVFLVVPSHIRLLFPYRPGVLLLGRGQYPDQVATA